MHLKQTSVKLVFFLLTVESIYFFNNTAKVELEINPYAAKAKKKPNQFTKHNLHYINVLHYHPPPDHHQELLSVTIYNTYRTIASPQNRKRTLDKPSHRPNPI